MKKYQELIFFFIFELPNLYHISNFLNKKQKPMILQAGYILDFLSEIFTSKEQKNNVFSLLKELSNFSLEFENQTIIDNLRTEKIALVVENIISRGTPTKASVFIEEEFRKIFNLTEKKEKADNNFNYSAKNDLPENFEELIFKALHIISPKVNIETQRKLIQDFSEKIDFNDDFLFSVIPTFFHPLFVQILNPNSNLSEIAEKYNCKNYLLNSEIEFQEEENNHLDFCLENPYNENISKKGVAINIEHNSYETISQNDLINQKKDFFEKINWFENIYVNTQSPLSYSEILKTIKDWQEANNDYFTILKENFESPLYEYKAGLNALQMALSPIGIARIQQTIIEAIKNGILDLKQKTWEIAVFERDIPCAYLAIEDLKNIFNQIENVGKCSLPVLPEIKLEIFNNQEFSKSKVNKPANEICKRFDKFQPYRKYDLLIDISVLERYKIQSEPIETQTKNVAKIRSSYSLNNIKRNITTSVFEYYRKSNNTNTPAFRTRKMLNFFLQDFFRKKELTREEGNLVHQILKRRNVINTSLSTEEKILPNILASILQTGSTLFLSENIDKTNEINNLLKTNNIDSFSQINSSNENRSMFYTIQPEKINLITENFLKERNINTLVINDIEKISEWRYNFNSAYNGAVKYLLEKSQNLDIQKVFVSELVENEALPDIFKPIGEETENIYRTEKTQNFPKILSYAVEDENTFETKQNKAIDLIINLISKNSDTNNLKIKLSKDLSANIFEQKIKEKYTDISLEIISDLSKNSKIEVELYNINIILARYNFFLYMPLHPTLFFEEIFGGDNDIETEIFIIYSDKKSKLIRQNIENQKEELIEISEEVFDNENIILSNYKGKDKEKTIIDELLNGIETSHKTNLEIISQFINIEIDKNLTLTPEPKHFPSQIAIKENDLEIGYIDYKTSEGECFEKDNSLINKELLLKIKEIINQNKSEDIDTFIYFDEKYNPTKGLGFNDILESLEVNETVKLNINSDNNWVEKLTELEISIPKGIENTHGEKDFIKKIQEKTNIELETKPKLEAIFKNMRTHSDTLLALYRLQCLGIVQNYKEESSGNIKIELKKIYLQDIIKHLYDFLNRYLSNSKTNTICSIIEKSSNEEILNLCIEQILDLTYLHILPRKYEGIKNMQTTCYLGEKSTSKWEIQESLENFLYAKYTPELKKSLNKQFPKGMEIVKNYIKESGDFRYNWLHLNNTTNLLLNKYKENYTILLLNSYSEFLVNANCSEKLIEASDALIKGFLIYQKQENVVFSNLYDQINLFISKAYKQKPELEKNIGKLILIKYYSVWIREFNQNFLEGYKEN